MVVLKMAHNYCISEITHMKQIDNKTRVIGCPSFGIINLKTNIK